jgi:MFS family permease
MEAFGATGTLVGLLSATYFYAYAAFMIPAGVLVDGFGVRRVVAVGGLVMGAGSLAMSLATGPTVLFTGRFLVGAGAAVTFVGALKIAVTWFPGTWFATLSALTAAMGVLGGLVGTAPLAWLAAVAGWRDALRVVGVITLAGAILCVGLVRDDPLGTGRLRGARSGPRLPELLAGLGAVLRNPLTWPLGREVNPPGLAGVAVAAVNLGGFLGVALTQGPLGGLLDRHWAGAMAGGARVYPVEAYRMAFVVCAALALGSAVFSLCLRETRGRNVWQTE